MEDPLSSLNITIAVTTSIAATVFWEFGKLLYGYWRNTHRTDLSQRFRAGKIWWGIHFSCKDNKRVVSFHKYNFRLWGSGIIGSRLELGPNIDAAEDDTVYRLNGSIVNGKITLTESSAAKMEVATTVIVGMSRKERMIGYYFGVSDFDSMPFCSPILFIDHKPVEADVKTLEELAQQKQYRAHGAEMPGPA